jgi:hypothetical protein
MSGLEHALFGFTLNCGCCTLTVICANTLELTAARIVAVPTPLAVTVAVAPVPATVATAELLDVHVTGADTGLPDSSRGVAVIWAVSPIT